MFNVIVLELDGINKWAVLQTSCNIMDKDDVLLNTIKDSYREVYGEDKIMKLAQPDTSIESKFDLKAITNALRSALPDPAMEAAKRPHLTNYRSETAELVARAALMQVYQIKFPASPQLGKTNPNQPILGFDGWGIELDDNGEFGLVLVQVKGTDDASCPPDQAVILADECLRAPKETYKIIRALSILVNHIDQQVLSDALLFMLEKLGKNEMPKIIIAPVIVRGLVNAKIDDLKPLRDICTRIHPVSTLGATVEIGTELTEFGRIVLEAAREAA